MAEEKMGFRGLRKRALLALIVLLAVAAAFVGGALFTLFNRPEEPEETEPVMTAETLEKEIQGIAQYASLEYRYTNVGRFEDRVDFYGWQVPFTTKNFIITYDGAMRLGIDGSDIQVSLAGSEIRIQLPAVRVLSHEIREDTLEVLDQSKNIFNQIQIEDYTSFATDQKQVMEQKAVDSGLFEEAADLAQRQLGDFLQALPGIRDTYTVTFVN